MTLHSEIKEMLDAGQEPVAMVVPGAELIGSGVYQNKPHQTPRHYRVWERDGEIVSVTYHPNNGMDDTDVTYESVFNL